MNTQLNASALFAAFFFLVSIISAYGQGTIIIQHSGSTNPTDEGFIIANGGGQGSATNFLGVNAWSVVTPYGGLERYYYSLNSQEQSQISTNSWILSAAFQMVSNSGVAFIAYDGFLYNITNSTGYNSYQIIFDATSATASFWMNGAELKSGLTSAVQNSVQWGDYSQSPGITTIINWNLVSLQFVQDVPEPSSMGMVLLSCVVVFIHRRRRKQHSTRAKPSSE
jgi:hypothetical protein